LYKCQHCEKRMIRRGKKRFIVWNNCLIFIIFYWFNFFNN
jgi:hypothetical protein